MKIKKHLWGNPIIQAVENNNRKLNKLVGNMLANSARLSEDISRLVLTKMKADLVANRKTKAPMKANELATLLDKLWRLGAFKGVKTRQGKDLTYELAVDGLIGRMTRQALANAREMGYNFDGYDINEKSGLVTKKYTPSKKIIITSSSPKPVTSSGPVIPTQVAELSYNALKPKLEEAADFLGNNPASVLINDITRATANRFSEALTGNRPFKGKVISNLPSLLKQELIKQVQFAKSRGQNYFDSKTFNDLYNFNYASKNGEEGKDRSGIWARLNSPQSRLEHTLGLYTFYTDDNGDTIVEDVYDFNDDLKQGGEGKYVNIRNNIAANYGSHSSEPLEGKIRYKINLGKI